MILIIDDNRLLLKTYDRVLSKISAVTISEGSEASRVIKKSDDISLVLMETEYTLAELDDILDSIRERYPKIPIIFVSNNEQSFKKEFVNWGISHFLVKPVDLIVLETTINHLLINQGGVHV